MPNEVIKQVHRLARTAEKYEGVLFTNMQGKILEDQNGWKLGQLNATKEDINNTHKEQSMHQSGQDVDSTGSNECNENETKEEIPMGILDSAAGYMDMENKE